MKKKIVNISISILFSVTFILTIVSLTALNKHFVMKVMIDKGYVAKITNNINNDLKLEGIDYIASETDVKEYLQVYIKSRYKYEKIDYGNAASDIINEHILFMGDRDYRKYSYIVYVITLVSIIITGNIFLKSKKMHDLATIYIYSFGIMVLIYGVIYFNIDCMSYIVRELIDVINHIILGMGVILLEMGVYKKRFKKLS